MTRGRPKKVSPPSSKKGETEPIPVEQVWDVLKFAAGIYGGNSYGATGIYTPMLTNDLMKQITLQPQALTADQVDKALGDPKNNEQNLIGASEFFELSNMLYKRILYYMGGLLSFNLSHVCINAELEDYGKPAYKKDLQIMQDFLDKFDSKKEFKTILRQMLRQEAYFGVLRDDGEKYTMQELNENYCIITGRWDYSLLFDINMYYFWLPGIDINMFPPVFKQMYERVFKNNKDNQYNPASSVANRDGSWVLYTQTDPSLGFWCFKFNSELATRVPFFAPMFPDVVNAPLIRKLQTSSYIAQATKMLIGKVPMLGNGVKGANVKDAVSLSPDLLGKFLALLKAGLSEAIKVGASPLENMAGIEFSGSTMYSEYSKTTGATSGISSRLIFSTDKPNSIESQLSVNVDEFLMEHVYPYFNVFLEYFVNRRTKKYKFKFFFNGTNFYTRRKENFDRLMQKASIGMVDYQEWANASDMLPHHFLKRLEESKAVGFVDKLTPIIASAQMSGANKGGAPEKDSSELTDEGLQAKDDASNES